MQKGNQSYIQTQFSTVGQGELLLMLYDGALRFLAQAREKMLCRDYAAKGVLISRALDVINELDSSLNQQLGGELAKNLHQLYFMCSTKLLQANLRMDTELLDSAVEILTGLRNAYAQIMGKPEAQAAAQQIAQRQQHSAALNRRPIAPQPATPMGVTRTHAQTVYSDALGAQDPTPAAQAAQATQHAAERAAEHLTRQATDLARTAVLDATAAASAAVDGSTPPLPSGLGVRKAGMARYGKMAAQS